MSHFTVMVVGPDIDDQLQPYHEYECTGVIDQYVIDVDVTDEVIRVFNQPETVLRLADGTLRSRWDPIFNTAAADPFIPKFSPDKKVFAMPPGAVEIKMPADEARSHGIGYATLEDCAKEYGYFKGKDGRFYKKTNPNAKWDWYSVGGRWTGYFLLKPRAHGSLGRAGLRAPVGQQGRADQALKGDIDFAGMRDAAETKARDRWALARRLTNGVLWESWDTIRARHADTVEARRVYWAQPAIVALNSHDEFRFDIDPNLTLDLDAYVKIQRDGAVSTYALVRDSKWTQRADMGMVGISTNEMPRDKWDAEFNAMLDALPDDTLLTLVDCHI